MTDAPLTAGDVHVPLRMAVSIALKEYERWRDAPGEILEIGLGGMGAAANIVAALVDLGQKRRPHPPKESR